MRITCDCGNEIEFKKAEPDEDDKWREEEYGKFQIYNEENFNIWSQHDDAKGIRCKACQKSIWFY
jgi:hypothetical protein